MIVEAPERCTTVVDVTSWHPIIAAAAAQRGPPDVAARVEAAPNDDASRGDPSE